MVLPRCPKPEIDCDAHVRASQTNFSCFAYGSMIVGAARDDRIAAANARATRRSSKK